MEQSELNKRFSDAVKPYVQLDWENDAANECERICLEKQIELLDDIFTYPTMPYDVISKIKQKLQEQLTQLK